MDTSSGGIAEKWNHFYWESVKRAHKLKILKYPLLCLLTLLFGIAFVVQACVNGILLFCHKVRSSFSHLKSIKFPSHEKEEDNPEPPESSTQADSSENKIFTFHFRYAAVLAAILLLAATGIFFFQKNNLSLYASRKILRVRTARLPVK